MTFANDHCATLLIDDLVDETSGIDRHSNCLQIPSSLKPGLQNHQQAEASHTNCNMNSIQVKILDDNTLDSSPHLASTQSISAVVAERGAEQRYIHTNSTGMSEDQLRLLLALKRHLRKIETGSSRISSSRVSKLAKQWEEMNNNCLQKCKQRLLDNRYFIDRTLGKSHCYFTELALMSEQQQQCDSESRSPMPNIDFSDCTNDVSSGSDRPCEPADCTVSMMVDECSEHTRDFNHYPTTAPVIDTAAATATTRTSKETDCVTKRYCLTTQSTALSINACTTSNQTTAVDLSSTVSVRGVADGNADPVCSLTWNLLVAAVCWAKLECDSIETRRCYEQALEYYTTHGESAAFLAAAAVDASRVFDDNESLQGNSIHYTPSSHTTHSDTLGITSGAGDSRSYSSGTSRSSSHTPYASSTGSFSTSGSGSSDTRICSSLYAEKNRAKQAALSFMRFFPDVMNEW